MCARGVGRCVHMYACVFAVVVLSFLSVFYFLDVLVTKILYKNMFTTLPPYLHVKDFKACAAC